MIGLHVAFSGSISQTENAPGKGRPFEKTPWGIEFKPTREYWRGKYAGTYFGRRVVAFFQVAKKGRGTEKSR
jgi:hypothetical protein